MRTLLLPLALLAALAAGCGTTAPVIPPAPGPAPVVDPAPPTPGPVREGRVLTEAEANSVAMGTGEAAIRDRFGPPVRVLALPAEGVRMLVYHASTPSDPTRFAEFWLTDGRLTRTVVY